eukprot:147442-Alexandrium_andersonii.AAC.1
MCIRDSLAPHEVKLRGRVVGGDHRVATWLEVKPSHRLPLEDAVEHEPSRLVAGLVGVFQVG